MSHAFLSKYHLFHPRAFACRLTGSQLKGAAEDKKVQYRADYKTRPCLLMVGPF